MSTLHISFDDHLHCNKLQHLLVLFGSDTNTRSKIVDVNLVTLVGFLIIKQIKHRRIVLQIDLL